jgi:hypothetical protein
LSRFLSRFSMAAKLDPDPQEKSPQPSREVAAGR